MGQLAGVVALGTIQATTFLVVGVIAGAGIHAGVAGALVIAALSLLISLGFGSIGAFVALRTGSGEAVQGIFPLMFAALFLSSMALPRDLIETDWFRTVATWNPVSYMLEGIRSLVITGWDGEALALGLRVRGRDRRGRAGRGVVGPADADGAHMSRGGVRDVALAVAWRGVHNYFTNPAMIIPGLLFPLFFFTAFAGGLSRVDSIPGFEFGSNYTAFVYGFVLLQASAFGGVFTGFSIARDFESGFSRRLHARRPAARRESWPGTGSPGVARAVFTILVVTTVALVTGMKVGGGGIDLVGLYVLALLVNTAATLFGSGVAMRLRTMQAGPAMQVPVFLLPLPRAGLAAVRPAHRLGARRRHASTRPRGSSRPSAGSSPATPRTCCWRSPWASAWSRRGAALGARRAAQRRARRLNRIGAWPTRSERCSRATATRSGTWTPSARVPASARSGASSA